VRNSIYSCLSIFMLKGCIYYSTTNIIAAAVKNSAWQGSDGIIKEGAHIDSNNDTVGFKGTSYHIENASPAILSTTCCIAVFIRGLAQAFLRNSSYTDLRVLIRSYTNVQVRRDWLSISIGFLSYICSHQYNALLDLAATGDTYSANWHGPPHAFTTWGQFASLDVFVSAIIAN